MMPFKFIPASTKLLSKVYINDLYDQQLIPRHLDLPAAHLDIEDVNDLYDQQLIFRHHDLPAAHLDIEDVNDLYDQQLIPRHLDLPPVHHGGKE